MFLSLSLSSSRRGQSLGGWGVRVWRVADVPVSATTTTVKQAARTSAPGTQEFLRCVYIFIFFSCSTRHRRRCLTLCFCIRLLLFIIRPPHRDRYTLVLGDRVPSARVRCVFMVRTVEGHPAGALHFCGTHAADTRVQITWQPCRGLQHVHAHAGTGQSIPPTCSTLYNILCRYYIIWFVL